MIDSNLVEFVERNFCEVVKDLTSGNHKIVGKDYLIEGRFPIIDQGSNFCSGYTNSKELLCKTELPCIIFGDHTRVLKYIDTPFALGADGVKVLKPIKGLDERYLFYFLKNLDIPSAGYSRHFKFLKEKKIRYPLQLSEQKRIVAILDKADSIRQKRDQAIMIADDFLRAKFLEMFGTPAHNVHHFPTGTIRDLVDSVNYGTSAKASVDSGKYPILRMGNITYQGGWDFNDLKYIDLNEKEKIKFLARKGDLLFNRTNSKELVGKTAVFEENKSMAFAGYLIRVRPSSIGNNYYISGYLNSTHGKTTLMNMCKSIVGMANINAQELQDIEILIPPKHLQDEYERIYKRVKIGSAIADRSAEQLQLLAANLANKYFM